MQSDRQDQFGYYGERVLDDLLALQQHLRSVKERTVDTVVLDGEDIEGLDSLDQRPTADPTEGAQVFATTDAFGSEAEALDTDLAKDVASGAVTGAEDASKAPAETEAPAETQKPKEEAAEATQPTDAAQ